MSGNIIKETKIDDKTLHFLPFVPSNQRKKGYFLEREWGSWKIEIYARETLNTYDLVTLLLTTREYLKNGYTSGYIEVGEDKKEIAGITINVKKFLLERGVKNKKVNRETLLKSFLRLKSIDITFTDKDTKTKTYTSYFYEIEVDKKITEIKISANKKFIEFITEKGILVNLERLLHYGTREQYAVLLDLYLQGTKRVKYLNNRKILQYRERYYTSEIEKALKLDLTNLPVFKKIQIIKESFNAIHKKGDMPQYTYNKIDDTWERKINKHKKVK